MASKHENEVPRQLPAEGANRSRQSQDEPYELIKAEEENPQEIVPEELREPIAEAYEQSTFLAELRRRAQARRQRSRPKQR